MSQSEAPQDSENVPAPDDAAAPAELAAPAAAQDSENAQASDDAVWPRLREAAVQALARAYAPYSGFPVGAAALTEDGRLLTGANVENAAYGVTLCAECSLVSELFRTGGGRLHRFVCVDARGEALMPCGRCRQLLHEHRGADLQVLTPLGVRGMEEILPQAFGPENLRAVTEN